MLPDPLDFVWLHTPSSFSSPNLKYLPPPLLYPFSPLRTIVVKGNSISVETIWVYHILNDLKHVRSVL